jgi:ribosomal protein S18 acetylase RimI-like enzyme
VIRPATADDLPLVRELWREFEAEIPEPEWHDDDELDEDLEWLAEIVQKETVLLADDVGLAVALMKGARLGFLEMLYVRPQARGSGIGRELTREASERLRARGAEVLELEVLASNAPARAIYDRWGFQTSELTLAAPIGALAQRLAAPPDGPTFGVAHVQTDDVDRVRRDAAKVLRAEPELHAANGWVGVHFDGDPEKLKSLARELSYTTAGVTLALGVERGMVVRYNLFDRGAAVDEYLSVPEFYGPLPPGDVFALGANPTVVARLTGADPKRVREVARTASSPAELPPAQELYKEIADVLGVES